MTWEPEISSRQRDRTGQAYMERPQLPARRGSAAVGTDAQPAGCDAVDRVGAGAVLPRRQQGRGAERPRRAGPDTRSRYPMRVYAAVLDALGRKREGLSWARRAVDAAPWITRCTTSTPGSCSTPAMPTAALPVATEAMRLPPDDADAHNLMGMVLATWVDRRSRRRNTRRRCGWNPDTRGRCTTSP